MGTNLNSVSVAHTAQWDPSVRGDVTRDGACSALGTSPQVQTDERRRSLTAADGLSSGAPFVLDAGYLLMAHSVSYWLPPTETTSSGVVVESTTTECCTYRCAA